MNSLEVALINRLQAGEEAAFEHLFHTYYALLCVYANKLLGDSDQAKEVVQGVFVRLYEQRETLPQISSLKSYLYKSVHNSCLNQLKQIKVYESHHQQLQQLLPQSEAPEELLQLELEEKIWHVVQELPEQCRKIFQMNRFDGRKNRQIAEELNLSIRTVETQISKALKILREALSDYLPLLLLLATVALF